MVEYLQTHEIAIVRSLAPLILTGLLLLASGLLYWMARRIALRLAPALAKRTSVGWDDAFVRRGLFRRLAALVPGVLAYGLAGFWMGPGSGMESLGEVLRGVAGLWMLFYAVAVLYALIDGCEDVYNTFSFARQLPIRGVIQILKLLILLAALVLGIAMLLGKSPLILVSGMGAMTAVLMLVFKDPILGFVAGIQLSANRMLAVGDWLEMPKYNADGDVMDITLTTVKVRNWDKTITTLPTYALISDSFKNWRGMSEAGGRRIMRSVFVDVTSIRFLEPGEVERLRKARLLAGYMENKLREIERDNRERNVDPASPVDARRLTNIGTFRAYLASYIASHPGINPDLIHMVRQGRPTPEGLPLEIYAFTRETAWVAYEGVQADIFDHVLAVIGEFGLRAFQFPSGRDLSRFGGSDRGERVSGKASSGDGHAERNV